MQQTGCFSYIKAVSHPTRCIIAGVGCQFGTRSSPQLRTVRQSHGSQPLPALRLPVLQGFVLQPAGALHEGSGTEKSFLAVGCMSDTQFWL